MFNVNTVKKYLPLGTVCLLKEAKKKVMIIGFAAKGKELGDKLFDYVGCVYPEGIITSNHNLLFNHNDIQDVFFIGFSNAEDKAFKEKLNEIVNSINNNNVTSQTANNNQMSNTNNTINNTITNNTNNNTINNNTITNNTNNNTINNNTINNNTNNNNTNNNTINTGGNSNV